MWRIKQFKTFKAMCVWVTDRQHKIQWEQIYVNNGYAIEYRKLRVMG